MLVFKPFSQTTVISEVEAVTSGVHNWQVAGLVLIFRQTGDHFGTGTLGAHLEPREQQSMGHRRRARRGGTSGAMRFCCTVGEPVVVEPRE